MLRNLMLKRGDKDKNNKLISFSIDDAIWTKIKDLKNIELNALPFCDDRYIKNKSWSWYRMWIVLHSFLLALCFYMKKGACIWKQILLASIFR